MGFNFEGGRSQEIKETPEVKVDSEQLSETDEIAETYDDCSLNEVQDRKGNEVNAESLEETEENYEDCGIKMKEKNSELVEEDDDFSDCGKEADGQYVAEVAYTTDGEISQEEASAELQEADNECNDPENMQQLKENENEHIEVHNAEVVERPENSEMGEENLSENVSRGVEEATDTELSDETKEQISEEVSENTSENLSDDEVDAMVEEKSETIEETIEEKAEEQEDVDSVKETADELEDEKAEQLSEQPEQSLQERINGAFEKEDVTASEINSLCDEHSAELQAKIEEKSTTEAELKTKFDEVLSKEKGSDEYMQSLQEYNELKEKKEMLNEQIVTMEEQQIFLDKKSLELREAQIQKGYESMEASAATLAGVNMLQERYDQTYYDTRADKTELASIRDDSCAAIKELYAEKDSIKQAMDAKMDEISKYITSNNMNKYKAANDLHCQQMSAEYISMKESYHRVDYSIVKLDENNKAITEKLGDEYVSMVELPPSSRIAEINDGTDVPGETNYFIDEAKASEVLSPFKQEKWEQLTIQEQKQAVEKIADYNAEILGVEDKPRIVYYNAEDPCDFGGYSDKQNAIYINEYNMHDAAETADTVSHEYRHKYQHERAEKLETERDLEFKESFDNYIRAEDDYQGYKEQLVESDARAYAQIVKDKIFAYSEKGADNIVVNTEQSATGSNYAKFNPEKCAVFEKISVEELPDDFEQKDRTKYREFLEAKEIDELRAAAGAHYENGKAVWGKLGLQELESYKEHHDIENGHIEKVRVKSLEAADTLESHFSQNNYDGLFSPNINRRDIEVMAIYHDTGMDGNIKAEDYDTERDAYKQDEAIREKFVADTVSEKEKEAVEAGKFFDRVAEEKKAKEKFEREGFETHFRSGHSLESAIHVLRDRESIDKLGISADEVALGCFVHSKSNSDLRNIAREAEWETAIDCLQSRVDSFNKSHPDEPIRFDSFFLLNDDGSFNQEKLAEMRSEAISLRIGDANGHDTNSRTSQGGKSIEFTLEAKTVKDEVLKEVENKTKNGNYEAYFREVQAAYVKVGGIELNNANDPKGTARMYAVGEGNFKSLSCDIDESGNIKQCFELCDGDAFPLSTQKCIEERIGEYETAKPMRYTPVVKLGYNCNDAVYESYKAFARRVKDDYGIRMEVIR